MFTTAFLALALIGPPDKCNAGCTCGCADGGGCTCVQLVQATPKTTGIIAETGPVTLGTQPTRVQLMPVPPGLQAPQTCVNGVCTTAGDCATGGCATAGGCAAGSCESGSQRPERRRVGPLRRLFGGRRGCR